MKRMSWVKGMIEEGVYKGKPIEVQFGKPIKILCDGKDITKAVVALHIELSVNGQMIYLKIAELDYSQVPSESWAKMVEAVGGRGS